MSTTSCHACSDVSFRTAVLGVYVKNVNLVLSLPIQSRDILKPKSRVSHPQQSFMNYVPEDEEVLFEI